jgi:cell division protein ZapA (FtsZ GTPase activity inhibitor)
MVSDAQKIQQAQFLKEASANSPGYDRAAVERRFLRALQITDIETVYPGPDKVPAPVPLQLQIAQIKAQTQVTKDQATLRMAAMELMGEVELNQAKIQELRAKAALHLAEAKSEESGHAIALLNAQIGAAKAHQDGLLRSAKIILDGIKMNQEQGNVSRQGSTDGGGVPAMAAPPSNPSTPDFPPLSGEGSPAGMA